MKTNLIILLLCLNFWARAQDNKVVDITAKGIKIGEKVPDAIIPNVLNYKSTSFKLSDFKGKWVIIDFWATWCGACINMRPTMQKLSAQFEDKLTFISVTYQTEAEVKPFFDKQKVKSTIPEVLADNLLHNWFPHRLLPHYVWIDPSGVLKAVTGSDMINNEQVAKMIAGDASGIKRKKDLTREFDLSKNFQEYIARDSTINSKYQSSYTKYIPGVPSERYAGTKGGSFIISLTNTTAYNTYRTAYSSQKYFSSKMIKLNIKDTTKLTTPLMGTLLQEWREKNAICYQVIVPEADKQLVYSKMQSDLRFIFPMYKAEIIKELKPCWVLEVIGDTALLSTKKGKPFIDMNDHYFMLKNAKLSLLINRLTKYYLYNDAPLFLQDGLDVIVDIELEASLKSLDSINKALERYGLAFVSRSKIQEVLIISDNL